MNKELIDEIRVLADKLTYSCADELEISYAKEIAKLCSKVACEAVEQNVGADLRNNYKYINGVMHAKANSIKAIKQALEGSDEKEGVV